MTQLRVVGHIPQWDLADRLAKSLRDSDLSVQAIADQLEVSRNSVGNWINGHNKPRRATLFAWATITGTDLHWLETGKAPGQSPTPSHTSVEGGDLLPRLDSNQQPSGYRNAQVSGLRIAS